MNTEERTAHRKSVFRLLVECIGEDITMLMNDDKRNGDEEK